MKRIFYVLVILFVFTCFTSGNAFGLIKEADSMKGLSAVSVEVLISGDYSDVGLTESQIRTDTELAFRQAGLTVIPHTEKPSIKGGVVSVAAVLACNKTSRLCAIHTEVSLMQYVGSIRNSSLAGIGVTWDDGQTGLELDANAEQNARNKIKDSISSFLNDYFSVNPR